MHKHSKKADYRKINDRTLNSSTYHKKDGTEDVHIRQDRKTLCGEDIKLVRTVSKSAVTHGAWGHNPDFRMDMCEKCLAKARKAKASGPRDPNHRYRQGD